MLAAIRMTCSLLKLRIGVAIAASALAGIAVANGPAPSLSQAAGLALAVLGASGAAGAFNHYYERDLDRLMRRTRGRPFARGAFSESLWWPASFLALLLASLALAYVTAGTMSALFVFLGAFTYGIVYTVWLKRRSTWNIVIGGLAGGSSGSEVVRYLSFGDHLFDNLFQGVVDLGDVMYFVSLTVLALFIGSQAVESRRWR